MVVRSTRPGPAALDLAYLGLFLGLRVNELVMDRMAASGFTNVRESHGFVIQHLIDAERTITELAELMEVTQQAYDDYVAAIDEAMAGTVWCHTPNAHTYYRSGSGRVVVANPYRLVDLWHQHRAPIEEHFELR